MISLCIYCIASICNINLCDGTFLNLMDIVSLHSQEAGRFRTWEVCFCNHNPEIITVQVKKKKKKKGGWWCWSFSLGYLFYFYSWGLVQPGIISVPELCHHMAEAWVSLVVLTSSVLQYKQHNPGKVRTKHNTKIYFVWVLGFRKPLSMCSISSHLFLIWKHLLTCLIIWLCKVKAQQFLLNTYYLSQGFDSLHVVALCQFCFMTCGVFSCLAVVGRYIPGLVLSYSAGESHWSNQS